MVDQNTRFIIKRMDEMEYRVNGKIDAVDKEVRKLQAFENRLLGMAIAAGGIGSLLVTIIARHFN